MSYLSRISATSDQKSASENKAAAKHAKLSVEAYITEKKKSIATREAALEAGLASVPFNVEAVVKRQFELEKDEAELAVAESLLITEFSDSETENI